MSEKERNDDKIQGPSDVIIKLFSSQKERETQTKKDRLMEVGRWTGEGERREIEKVI